MSYATLADLTTRYGTAELIRHTDRGSPPLGAPDAVLIQRELDSASGLIDGYLAPRYTLPIAGAIPAQLVDLCCRLTRYGYWSQPMESTDKVLIDQRQALSYLSDIAAGRAQINVAGITEPVSGGGEVWADTSEPVFNPCSLAGY